MCSLSETIPPARNRRRSRPALVAHNPDSRAPRNRSMRSRIRAPHERALLLTIPLLLEPALPQTIPLLREPALPDRSARLVPPDRPGWRRGAGPDVVAS